jgi:hypothetical protein
MEVKSTLASSALKGTPVQAGDIPHHDVTWFNTAFQGHDIGTSPEGDVYVVGMDGKLYYYNFLANMYTLVEGDIDIPAIARVDVDADGTPYVVCTCGQVYYLNCYNHWVQLPGCGTDIGVGRAGDIWKIGCDDRAGGYGIWKLHCKCKCKCNCERSCMRFRPMHYSAGATGDQRKCFWYRIEGGATRVDVAPDGNPWVVTHDGVVYGYDGVNWLRVNGVLGRDITVSNDSMVMVAGLDAAIYSLQNANTSQWISLSGSALEISAGPFSQPWVCAVDNYAYTTAKFEYN